MTEDMRGSDAERLARDWITVWQSELAALAADPEMHEVWGRMAQFWAQTMQASARTGGFRHDASGCAGPHAPPGSASAADAPAGAGSEGGAGTDAVRHGLERLRERMARLEQRLDQLENPA